MDKVLVAYFSHPDENYNVGFIEKGNTKIIAEIIAKKTGAEEFEIERVDPYPKEYKACVNESVIEKKAHARPKIRSTVRNFDEFDTVFIGFPNWCGDMPMPVYTFLETYDFTGKTVIPFCTHGGSGLSDTVNTLKMLCKGATVLDGFDIYGIVAQNDKSAAEVAVEEFLSKL